MIITITGKPCSGKGSISKYLCSKYNFDYVCTGDMFRKLSKQHGYDNILHFQQSHDKIKDIDKIIDNKIEEIGKTRINDNVIIDSRLAWHFIPDSFKVFIDIDWNTAADRLLNSNRDTEKAESRDHAIKILKDRWNTENIRYQELYKIDNNNYNNYDFVINSDKSIEELSEIIYKEYKKFIKK